MKLNSQLLHFHLFWHLITMARIKRFKMNTWPIIIPKLYRWQRCQHLQITMAMVIWETIKTYSSVPDWLKPDQMLINLPAAKDNSLSGKEWNWM